MSSTSSAKMPANEDTPTDSAKPATDDSEEVRTYSPKSAAGKADGAGYSRPLRLL